MPVLADVTQVVILFCKRKPHIVRLAVLVDQSRDGIRIQVRSSGCCLLRRHGAVIMHIVAICLDDIFDATH